MVDGDTLDNRVALGTDTAPSNLLHMEPNSYNGVGKTA